jgi:hypothetical protein
LKGNKGFPIQTNIGKEEIERDDVDKMAKFARLQSLQN